MRLVLVSDTHRMHDRLVIPEGDVLVHAGDLSSFGTRRQIAEVAEFLAAQPHPHKVVIAGNHDWLLQREPETAARAFPGCHYLFDSGVAIDGLRFWGSPWQPEFLDWAFNLPRGAELAAKWSLIPRGTDVLVTHGPPLGILDAVLSGEHVGCEDLREAVERLAPRLHVFGHIHEGYGVERAGATLFVNASSCTADYAPINAPIVVDLEPVGPARVVAAASI